jgi:Tol biopolymer transport system component/tRNA A-37 threonylcarbamoyl transferase component Bud32
VTPERWQQVKELLASVLEHEVEERAAFLERVCGGDEGLRREVESLLASFKESDSIIEAPVAWAAADLFSRDQSESLVGQRLGHYEIMSLLGEGGMGAVYLAKDTTLGRRVALKLLPREHTQDEERLRRFKQEAKAASALNHPNILTIHEVGEADGYHFIATEFIDGETLRGSLRRAGKMKTSEALKVAAQVASALTTAHEAGIVHRDIKPENIMIRRDGYVKVLDFGIAKLTETSAPQTLDTSAPTLSLVARTESGVVLGTAQYMSPEQAAGKKVDARSDIFSFGAVLYEMVTAQRAFQGDSLMGMVAAILSQEPKPLPPKVPHDLTKIILRCLRKDPARRYQTMADLKVALEDLREESGSVRQAHLPLQQRWIWAAALLLILVVSGLFVWQPWRAPQDAEPLRAVSLTTLPGVERYPSFSPDGNHVAFTWTGSKQDNPDIYVQMIGSGSPLRLTTDPSNDYNPVWSPDGRWIAFLRRQWEAGKSELRLIPPLGGPERKLAEIHIREAFVNPPYLAWCPEGNCLVVTDSPGEGKPAALFVISLETGEKRQLTNPQPPKPGDTNPAISPDGGWLVFRRNASGPYTGELYRLPLGRGVTAVGEPRRLTLAALDADYPTWMPDGKEILFSAKGSLWRLVVPGDSTPARLPFVGEDGLMPVVSLPQPGRPPRLVYVRSFLDTNVWRVETSAPGAVASSPPVVSLSSTRGDFHQQLSPDGRRVALGSVRSGESEIWLADPDGTNAVQLTSIGSNSGYPRWSSDGEWIVFHSNLEGQWEVYVIPAAGGKPRNLTSHPATDTWPSFSRDGKWIYFTSDRTGERQIWKMPASGRDAVQVTHNVGHTAFESPDGAYIYYTQTRDKPSPLWRLPASGGVPVKVLEGVVLSNFVVLDGGIYSIDRPSGEGGIHNIDRPSGETRLQYFDFATRRSTTVARNLGNVDIGLTASPDGRTILYTRVDSSVDDLMLVENFR